MQKQRERGIKRGRETESEQESSAKMATGVRELNVLGEFKPFGLIAEGLDGKSTDNVSDKYDYFLFDPDVTRERDEFEGIDSSASSSISIDGCDHEIFIRGDRIMWITGSRVYKRFTLSSAVTMACWCHMAHSPEAVLCILQVDALTVFSTAGELTSVPLPGIVTSIWPLPFGLLVQQAAEGNPPTCAPLSSSVPFLSGRDTLFKREVRQSPQQGFDFSCSDDIVKENSVSVSSHLILNDPLEEPQPVYVDERGELKIMKDFDERTIWTSDRVPLIASHNRDQMQHSLWVAESMNSCVGDHAVSSSHESHSEVFPCRFSFRRIWQAKGYPTAATKVFVATDDDAAPIICFLLQEQKRLLSIRLHTIQINDGILFDMKADTSWSLQAVAAEPVAVTRPRAKAGHLPLMDILVLDSENTLFLYSGKQCLCKYILPLCLGNRQLQETIHSLESRYVHDMKIIGLADGVGARVNVILSNGQMLRCALRRGPSCSLANDCITAMAEGLSTPFYKHFLQHFWGNCETADLPKPNSGVDEWESFKSVILQHYRKSQSTSQPNSVLVSSSWEFLVNSEFHKNYCNHNFFPGISTEGLDDRLVDRFSSSMRGLQNPEGFSYSEFLIECLDSLHAIYENLKLSNLRKRDLEQLVVLLCEIANFLGEESYIDHYVRDFPFLSKIIRRNQTSSPRSPPSLYRWLESCLLHGVDFANLDDIPPLARKNGSSCVSWSRKVVSFYSLLSGAENMGGKLSSGVSCKIASGSSSNPEEKMVLAMVAEGFGLQQLDLLPIGVSLPLRHAVDKCRESPPTGWPATAYVLLGREDLALCCVGHLKKSEQLETQTNRHLISMSAPYMLHLQPVTVPSTVSDTIAMDTSKFDNVDSSDESPIDGMEHLSNSSTQLRYGRDLRLNEVRRLLCSARPVAIQTSINPTASDQELQQAQLWQFAQRTTALPLGRGAFTLATSCTLLTEALTVPKLVLAGRLPAQQNATVNLDPNMRNLQELRAWPEFHNAVAAGLRLAPFQGRVSRTWIIYNRPEEPNAIHAGLLFALGLHGHLTVLTINDIFQYYNKGHESTTVGLMLGLAASYRGTMEPTMSKSFYVHLPARHPSSFPELEVPTVLQSAALMSLGLLFEGSAHPQTMQFLMAEIGRRSGGDNVLEREGYAVSAGFALGLVALGRGEDKFACMDTLVDRLFHYAGEKIDASRQEKSPFISVTDEHSRGVGQMLDGVPVNVDVTAPGAIIALALLFLKTESEVIVSRLSIPRTNFELQYLRPDFIMLRVIARNLIMWSRVKPTKEWVESQIPQIVKEGIGALGDERTDMDEVDEEAIVQAYMNIVAGACISLGLKYAGSRNANAQELLYSYAIYFLNEIKSISGTAGSMFPRGLLKFVDRSTLEICLHLAVLSLALVMAGSGNLQTFRLLRFLRGRNSSDGQANFGTQMTVSLAIGFLFLGGGMRSFSSSKSSIAALLVTLYPRFPTGTNDNRCHLQAYRHFYVLATEARWIQTVDVDTGLPVYAPLEITVKETEHHAETSFCEVTPCLLPERAILKSVRVCGPRYWPQVIELTPEDKPWWLTGDKDHPFNSGVLYIKRKVGACSYVDDPVGCQSLISRAMNKAFSLTSMLGYASKINRHPEPGSSNVDHLVSTFSSDPSLIAFAQLCGNSSWNSRSDVDFQEFCLQVLFECVSKDRPALLQVYMSLYTMIRSMTDQVTGDIVTFSDSLSISSLKLVVAYNEALLRGRLSSSRYGIVQSNFLGSLRKRVEELFSCSHEMQTDLRNYWTCGKWPDDKKCYILLSWYLQWYCVPSPSVIQTTIERLKPKLRRSSAAPLLRLVFPRIHVRVISEMDKMLISS
ncbi:anaphase-promoting complex subunit 1 isoform X2 [Spinacia oleracea]|uniref:Anaphase-promoting complex subunit 1 isoform X2 n=1 Tax=Spinacia oleracea TaxID=3562 RepID=A0A9R0JA16_SPIOL|nr:anaphase-promoting complex subunit 1 isoform X2 [Spinacia oleracea]